MEHRLVGVAGVLACTALFELVRWHALKTGELLLKGAVVYRDKSPRLFRIGVSMYFVLEIMSIGVAIAIAFGIV